jgi:hypothetical protein
MSPNYYGKWTSLPVVCFRDIYISAAAYGKGSTSKDDNPMETSSFSMNRAIAISMEPDIF